MWGRDHGGGEIISLLRAMDDSLSRKEEDPRKVVTIIQNNSNLVCLGTINMKIVIDDRSNSSNGNLAMIIDNFLDIFCAVCAQ